MDTRRRFKFAASCLMKNLLSRLTLATVAALPLIAYGQDGPPKPDISVAVRVLRGDNANPSAGKKWVPAGTVQEGEKLYYTVRVRNPDKQPMTNVVIVREIPAGTVYVPGSASAPGADARFSADGGKTFGSSSQLVVTDSSGKSRPAAARDLTHIRWKFSYPLAGGATALVRFAVIFRGS